MQSGEQLIARSALGATDHFRREVVGSHEEVDAPRGSGSATCRHLCGVVPDLDDSPRRQQGLYTMISLGAITAVLALISLAIPDRVSSEGLIALMGLLFVVSRWVMGFSAGFTAFAWTARIVGAVSLVAGARRGCATDPYGTPWTRHGDQPLAGVRWCGSARDARAGPHPCSRTHRSPRRRDRVHLRWRVLHRTGLA